MERVEEEMLGPQEEQELKEQVTGAAAASNRDKQQAVVASSGSSSKAGDQQQQQQQQRAASSLHDSAYLVRTGLDSRRGCQPALLDREDRQVLPPMPPREINFRCCQRTALHLLRGM